MTPKKSYSRYFIILQEDEKGYSLDSDKIPSGYAKLEMKNNKCKISYYLQNLRNEKQPYYMILICGKKEVNKIIKIGKLNIDDYGRVDISHEYDMDNIADTGISMDKIVGAAIVKFVDTNVISIMSGFSTSEKLNDWKNYKVASENVKQKEPTLEDKINEFDEYEQNIETIKYKNQEENNLQNENNTEKEIEELDTDQLVEVSTNQPIDELEVDRERNTEIKVKCDEHEQLVNNQVENIRDDTKEEENKDVENKEDILEVNELKENVQDNKFSYNEDISNIARDKKKQKSHEEEKKEEYPTGVMGEFFKTISKDFEKITNFSDEIKWCTWHKVPIYGLEHMYDSSDYNKYAVVYYPMISYYPYIKNHKHFMLGYKCDSKGQMKYIVYGIPGTRCKIQQPYEGKTGFVTWIEDKENKEMGYWLMFYDFKNSTVVVPLKK